MGVESTDYEIVAASQTDQPLGAVGSVGTILQRMIIVPATTSPGSVQIEDGTDATFTVFTGGAGSLSNLAPITVELNMRSRTGAWEVTTGANVSVICVGRFPK